MATIRERTDTQGRKRYNVQVRLRGYPLQTATFERKTDAEQWAQHVESEIRAGRYFGTVQAKKRFTVLGERLSPERVVPVGRWSCALVMVESFRSKVPDCWCVPQSGGSQRRYPSGRVSPPPGVNCLREGNISQYLSNSSISC